MTKFEDLLDSYSGSSPLFLQDDFVLFPKTGHDFRITDKNNIDMIKDVITQDRFLTLSLFKEGLNTGDDGPPPIYDIGTLAYVIDFRDFENEAYNLLILGVDKVQINETVQTHSYRIGETTQLTEITDLLGEDYKRDHLVNRFEELLKLNAGDVPIHSFNEQDFTLEIIINMMCAAMPIPATEKQKLLELQDINLRYEILVQFIDAEIAASRENQQIIPVLPVTRLMN